MRAVLTSDGFVQIRYDSNAGEELPNKHDKIEVSDRFNKGTFIMEILDGTEAIDMYTRKIYLLSANGWGEF